jgi:hypothetical protein
MVGSGMVLLILAKHELILDLNRAQAEQKGSAPSFT